MLKCDLCKTSLIVHNIRSKTFFDVYAHCPTCHTPYYLDVPKHIPDKQIKKYLNAKV